MIGVSRRAQGFTKPAPRVMNTTTIPAPNGGIDARAALGNQQMDNSIYSYNVVPNELGMTVRSGYREWSVNLDQGAAEGGVKTLVVFDGTTTTPSDNRLFAMTNEGIWDVTNYNAPVFKIGFADTANPESGHGVYAHYTDQSGDDFLLYADSANGMFEYKASTDTWIQYAGVTGPDPTKIAFVMVHKQRMWVVEQDSNVGWYLPIASKGGQATEFYFGPKFTHGGELIALINWSVDGGNGVDDYLVAVSSAGDVIPYQGTDPAVTTGIEAWTTRGTYFIGKIPAGRRFYSEYSGELYLLSSFGIIAMSDLLRGVDSRDVSHKSITFPIAIYLRRDLFETSEKLGWEPIFLPSQGLMIIDTPHNNITNVDIQYTMNLATEGWGILRDVPSTVFTEWDNRIFFGTLDHRICIMDTPRDNVLIDEDDPLADGKPIVFSLLTSYSDAGAPSQFKRGQMVRSDFISERNLNFRAKLLYDFQTGEEFYPIGSLEGAEVGAWDIGTWDSVVWGSGAPVNYNKLQGSGGMGRVVAVAIQGEAVDLARLLSFDVMWVDGGPV